MSGAVTRRSALTAALVAAAGGVAGYLWGRSTDATKAVAGSSGYGAAAAGSPLVALAAVPDGGGVIRDGVVVVREASVVHAFSARCTHLGCTVSSVKGGRIFCPCHGSVFDARTGAVVQSPATAPLSRIPVTVRNGEVYRA